MLIKEKEKEIIAQNKGRKKNMKKKILEEMSRQRRVG